MAHRDFWGPQIPQKHNRDLQHRTKRKILRKKGAFAKRELGSPRKSKGHGIDHVTAQGSPKPSTLREPTRYKASIYHLEGY